MANKFGWSKIGYHLFILVVGKVKVFSGPFIIFSGRWITLVYTKYKPLIRGGFSYVFVHAEFENRG